MCHLWWLFSHQLTPFFPHLEVVRCRHIRDTVWGLCLFFVASGFVSCDSQRWYRLGGELELDHHVAGAIQTVNGELAHQRRSR